MMTILAKSDDVRSGRKAKARHGRLRPARESMGQWTLADPSEAIEPIFRTILLARVVQTLGNAIHRINHYSVDSVVCFVNTYPLGSGL